MIRTYFNEKASIWDAAIAEKDSSKLEKMADRLTIRRGSTILDVGSGTGVFIPYLLRKLGDNGKLFALDIAEQMLKISNIKNHTENVIYIQGDITHTPFKEGLFDAIICYSSFPHFQDKPKALQEMARLLKKTGSLYICHTSGRDFINGIHQNIPLLTNDLLPDSEMLLPMMKNAGYTNIRIEDEPDTFFVCGEKTNLKVN